MPPPETYEKSEIGSQPTMCQVHTGAYASLLTPGKTDYLHTACPRKTTTYILHVPGSTYYYAYARLTSSQFEKERKKKKESEKT